MIHPRLCQIVSLYHLFFRLQYLSFFIHVSSFHYFLPLDHTSSAIAYIISALFFSSYCHRITCNFQVIREGDSSVSKPTMVLLLLHLKGQCLKFYSVGRKLLWDFSAEMHVPLQSTVSTYCLQLNLQETTSMILASPHCEAKAVYLPGFPQACTHSAYAIVLAVGDAA